MHFDQGIRILPLFFLTTRVQFLVWNIGQKEIKLTLTSIDSPLQHAIFYFFMVAFKNINLNSFLKGRAVEMVDCSNHINLKNNFRIYLHLYWV